MLSFFWAILDPLDKNERIYSDFYALFTPILAIIVGGLNHSDWVGMVRFQHAEHTMKKALNPLGIRAFFIVMLRCVRDSNP